MTIISKVSVTVNFSLAGYDSATTATASYAQNRHFETDVNWKVLTRTHEPMWKKINKNICGCCSTRMWLWFTLLTAVL